MNMKEIIGKLSSLIAIQEGYLGQANIPWKQRNPGDLIWAPSGTQTPDGKFAFTLHSEGWAAHEALVANALSGQHAQYPAAMSWAAFSQTWTGSAWPNPWGIGICHALTVDPQSRVADWVAYNLTQPAAN